MSISRILTRRQLEFLALSAQGMKYAEIASACFVSCDRVNEALEEARSRLCAKNTLHAVAIAISLDLIVFDANSAAFVANSSLISV